GALLALVGAMSLGHVNGLESSSDGLHLMAGVLAGRHAAPLPAAPAPRPPLSNAKARAARASRESPAAPASRSSP
ncbi:MAG TPA: hypothetical protein VH328_12360, partial [Burkholderiaceae bacterium]|nr:hypothetical protein [Burkholderiaceae bacterium]